MMGKSYYGTWTHSKPLLSLAVNNIKALFQHGGGVVECYTFCRWMQTPLNEVYVFHITSIDGMWESMWRLLIKDRPG